ncbi:MAG: hypothetical protein ACLQB1_09295 [Streptosporangiaceae bacterium]
MLVGERLGEGGQGVVHEAAMGSVPCVVKWYRPNQPADLRHAIAKLAERERPHPAFIWPIDLVVSDEMPGFGYVMPRLDAQADHDMAHRTGLCPALRTEVMLVPLTERRPVASGQDWLKDAGSVPAALLDGNGNMEPVR